MNLPAFIARLFRQPATPRLATLFDRPPGPEPSALRWRRSGRAVVATFALLFVALNVFAVFAMDAWWPRLRDPEYGIRVEHLRERVAENPGRPVVLVIGSSRVSMGLRPAAWEEARPNVPGQPDPLIFNMSLVGSGPIMELMCLRRVYDDGLRPDAVVIEYWPPFLREDGPFHEPDRIDHNRLFRSDLPLVRDYFKEPAKTERQMRVDRFHPFFETRHRLLAQLAPRWQPWDRRMEMSWANIDPWGWLPGLNEYPPVPSLRAARLEHCEKIYRDQFKGYEVHDLAVRAIRETVALARSHGARVAFTYLPEASEFRSWMPPEVDRAAQERLTALRRELDVPVINARFWLADGYMVDGFHLSRQGAEEFSRKFGPAVAATFPDLKGKP